MDDMDDDSSVASGMGPRGPLSAEERKARAMADALNWLHHGSTGGEADLPDAEERKARAMADALNWLRHGSTGGEAELPEDQPSWDWNRNRPAPGADGPTPYDLENGPDGPMSMPRNPSSPDEDDPEWSWNRNRPVPPLGLELIENPDVIDGSAPWASEPDEESDDGHGPRPMAIPEDLYADAQAEMARLGMRQRRIQDNSTQAQAVADDAESQLEAQAEDLYTGSMIQGSKKRKKA
jgi:hypothetical protein